MRTAFEREGAIRGVDLLAAFAALWRERASGILHFSRPGEKVRFEIVEGDVGDVSSSDSDFDAIEVLVRAGKIDPAALEGRVSKGEDRARSARDHGLLTERDWRWGERIRVVEILSHLVGWLEGSYAFDAAARPEPGQFRVGIHRVLLELFLRSRDRAFVHHALPSADAPLLRGLDFDEKFATLGLTPDALRVVAAIDGRASAAEISRRAPPDPFSVEKLLAALATLGLLHPEYAAEESPTEPRPAPVEPAEEVALPVPPDVAEPEKDVTAPEPPEPVPAPDADEPEIRLPETEIDFPLAAPVEPSEPEPALLSWENAPPEPMDQPLDVSGPEVYPSSRPRLGSVWLLLILAAAVVALLVFRSREAGRNPSAAGPLPVSPTAFAGGRAAIIPTAPLPAATTTLPRPIEAPTLVLPAAATAALPTPLPSTPLPATRPPASPRRAPPTAVPSPPSPAPPRVTAARPVTSGRTRSQWDDLAERGRRLPPRARYTIQLELACEISSLEEAWKYNRGAMWIVPAEYRGRSCFRVFWGRYPSIEAARRAKGAVPRFFFTPTNHPAVVSTGPALLH